ncbi:nickel pincer cofactor biosynthesis protein LarC [Nonomuraea insulae]|uniref:Nickel pincer cofactor biosynthesis protein LarC n=1 Tax=Nonomuraea insulae TaxID=1616787 RepID=A0ABW1CYV2_9ACTN
MILWLNPSAGISGDMLLGALLDLGAPIAAIEASIASTGITGWSITPRRVSKNGIAATYADVVTDDGAPERHASELLAMVRAATPAPVARLAAAAVSRIAAVEARIHDSTPERVHLHEIGGLDTVVDVVGVAAGLHALGITAVYSGSVALGGGSARSAHGVLPSPAPATMRLLAGALVHGVAVRSETTTPTGAALLAAMLTDYGPLPPVTITRTGHGAGSKDFPGHPNVLQASLCAGDSGVRRRDTVMLETNLDDVTGEQLGVVIAGAMARGAFDAWVQQTVGKKGRPAHVVHLLCSAGLAEELEEFLFAETGTLGVRRAVVERRELPRWTGTVDVDGQPVSVKYSPYGHKAEHDDLLRAAAALGRPVRAVAAQAATLAAAARRTPTPPPPAEITGAMWQGSSEHTPGDGRLGDGGLGDGDSGDGDPRDGDPRNSGPGNGDPGNGDPGNGDPGNGDPGNGDPGNSGPGNSGPGNSGPGDGDPGDGGPGDDDQGNGGAANGASGQRKDQA